MSAWASPVLLLAALLVACAGPPAPAPQRTARIYVVARDWHTDVALPAAAAAGPLAAVGADFPGVRMLVVGFGDRAYLTGGKPGPLAMLRALLPGPGALLVTALAAPPEAAFGAGHVVALPVTPAAQARLAAHLARAFALRDGRPVRLGPGPYPGSAFYAATDRYSAAYTCNTWTADALAASGLPVRADGVLFASQVMAAARHLAPPGPNAGADAVRRRGGAAAPPPRSAPAG